MYVEQYKKNIDLLRTKLQCYHLDAYIFLTGDSHASEYTAEYFHSRSYFSCFYGSAGTLLVTKNEVILWTDSRYYIEAEILSKKLHFSLMKDGLNSTPSLITYIAKYLKPKSKIGVDGNTISVENFLTWNNQLLLKGITLIAHIDIYQYTRPDRPELPKSPIYLLSEQYTGLTARDKIKKLAHKLQELNLDYYLVCPLDSIAYITNLRGQDVHYNLTFYAYLLIKYDCTATLFCNTSSLSLEVKNYLSENHIHIDEYTHVKKYFKKHRKTSIYASSTHLNYNLYKILSKKHVFYLENKDWIQFIKMCKNTTEITHMKLQFIQDGVAYVRFLQRLRNKEFNNEYQIVEALNQERQKNPLYITQSFPSIVGSESNASIVHYNPTAENHSKIRRGLLLIDSGAHYYGATTDITRTYCIEEVSYQAKYEYSLVLKAHITLARSKFPKGSAGAQLDGISRFQLWNKGYNFGHGTGHGVGFMLNVHEEPFRINKNNTTPIQEGMVSSNEPGLYRDGIYGIRIENVYIASPVQNTEFDNFLQWQPLTLAPIATDILITSLLDKEDIQWLNTYHKHVYEQLSPFLDNETQKFLIDLTQPVVH